jgi:hypothetical protein
MPIESNVKVVNLTGATVLQVDENGMRDGQTVPRVFSPFKLLFDRIFTTPLAAYIWTCQEGTWRVSKVSAMVSVTGGAAATCDVLVCTSAQAPASGTTQLTGTMDVEATAPFLVQGVVIASPTIIHPGMSLARVIGGTVGSLEGALTIQIERLS